MAMFIDISHFGGISAILSPLEFANNPRIGKLYNPKLPLNTILYVNANNLYGWAMSQYLPTGGFEWVEVSEIEDWVDFILKQGDEQEEGYSLDVDLEHPEELSDLYDTYHCALENIKIDEKYLSEHWKKLGKECG